MLESILKAECHSGKASLRFLSLTQVAMLHCQNTDFFLKPISITETINQSLYRQEQGNVILKKNQKNKTVGFMESVMELLLQGLSIRVRIVRTHIYWISPVLQLTCCIKKD